MRIRFLLVCLSAGLVAGGFALLACGSTETEAAADAGVDAAEASAPDTSVADANDGAPSCDPTTDILFGIQDASMGDTGTTTGVCASCAKTKCAGELGDCSKDCICQNIAGDAVGCYMKGGNILTCGAKFATVPVATRNIGIALFGCLNQECATECATAAFDPDAGDGGDGG